MSEGFFSRWSRRKQETRREPEDGSPRFACDDKGAVGGDGRDAGARDGSGGEANTANAPHGEAVGRGHPEMVEATAQPAPIPTLDDVRTLTPESNFQPFMQSGVGAEVRNAAMKKLFTDPHFNVMDGLDIYIEDYNQPDPMPAGMLQKMASAQFLKLVPPEEGEANAPSGSEVVAQSPVTLATAKTPSHDHPDLQLQPDPSPADPSAEPDAR